MYPNFGCVLGIMHHWLRDIPHIDLCAIEYSLGEASTALKHGDEACLHIWHLTWKLSIASPNLSCELQTDKMNLLTKCFSAIWFLTNRTTWENSDFAWKNRHNIQHWWFYHENSLEWVFGHETNELLDDLFLLLHVYWNMTLSGILSRSAAKIQIACICLFKTHSMCHSFNDNIYHQHNHHRHHQSSTIIIIIVTTITTITIRHREM